MSDEYAGRFSIDVETGVAIKYIRNEMHSRIRNDPCNCPRCLVNALVYGVAVVEQDEDDETVYGPIIEKGKIKAFSPAYMSKLYIKGETYDALADIMIENGFRALTSDRRGSPNYFFADLKEKSNKRRKTTDSPVPPSSLMPKPKTTTAPITPTTTEPEHEDNDEHDDEEGGEEEKATDEEDDHESLREFHERSVMEALSEA
jgi:hypothetical protein